MVSPQVVAIAAAIGLSWLAFTAVIKPVSVKVGHGICHVVTLGHKCKADAPVTP